MIKVAFVGTGAITRRHFDALSKLRNQASVVAVCDVIEERAVAAAAPWGAHAYLSFAEMIRQEQIDALYVCLPPDAHTDQELTAIERGIHLFVEKPLPLDPTKALAIAHGAQRAGIVTAVGYHWRQWDHVQRVRAALRHDQVGMAVASFLNVLPGTPWWRVRSRSGGQVVEQAIHMLDLSRFLLGEVESVYAAYALRGNAAEPGHDQDDTHVVTLRFASGAIGTLQACSTLHRRYRVGLEIICKHKAYTIRESEADVDTAAGVEHWARGNDAGLAENVAFLKAIATGDHSGILSDYADAWKTQQVALAANESAASGEVVRIGAKGHNA